MEFLTDGFLISSDSFALAWDWDTERWSLWWHGLDRGLGFSLGPLYVRMGSLRKGDL